jgi:hypothetical protein
MARTANPKDCKNATFDEVSLFFVVDLLLGANVAAGLIVFFVSLFNTSIPPHEVLSLPPLRPAVVRAI